MSAFLLLPPYRLAVLYQQQHPAHDAAPRIDDQGRHAKEGTTDKADTLAGRSPRPNARIPVEQPRAFPFPSGQLTISRQRPLLPPPPPLPPKQHFLHTTINLIRHSTYRTTFATANQCTYPPLSAQLSLSLPLPLVQEMALGMPGCCLRKRVVIALARETQPETYPKDYTDPFASVAL